MIGKALCIPVVHMFEFMRIRLYVYLYVHVFFNFSCPLRNSDTVQDIFMKLGTNINHHQTMCREQEPTLRSITLIPLRIF